VQIWDVSAGKKIRTMTYERLQVILSPSFCALTLAVLAS